MASRAISDRAWPNPNNARPPWWGCSTPPSPSSAAKLDTRSGPVTTGYRTLGHHVTSLGAASCELRLIEVKGLVAETGTILFNERQVSEDRRDCYRLYVVTNYVTEPRLRNPSAIRLASHGIRSPRYGTPG